MRVPTALAAVSVATSAVLLLSACGGSDSKNSDKITGVPTVSPSASASPTATVAAGRPAITLPADVTLVFDPIKSGDPTKNAVLADNEQYVRALDAAIVANDPKDPLLSIYSSGNARAAAASWVDQHKKANWSITGTFRYFSRNVTLNADGSASLIYCSDESQGYGKDRKTGKPQGIQPPSKDDYVLYNTRLSRNPQGIWQTTQLLSQRGAEQCQK